jgi:DNA-binding CsgD family transcriptional regulator
VSCARRFLSLSQVQRELGLTRSQVTALIETGALPAFQILGEWRVEHAMLDQMVDRLYEQSGHPAHAISAVPSESHPAGRTPASVVSRAPLDAMTPQQQRIGHLVAEGLSNAEIANRLSLEISTVKSHISRMLQRLNLHNRQQLVACLWRTGFIPQPETGTCADVRAQDTLDSPLVGYGARLAAWPNTTAGRLRPRLSAPLPPPTSEAGRPTRPGPSTGCCHLARGAFSISGPAPASSPGSCATGALRSLPSSRWTECVIS